MVRAKGRLADRQRPLYLDSGTLQIPEVLQHQAEVAAPFGHVLGTRPDELVFPAQAAATASPAAPAPRCPPTTCARVYQAAVAAAGEDLAHLDLRGPHDLRHTFATWLEDAGIPSRVIDELMGHSGGRRAGGSPMGRVYRETTPAMLARVTAALDDRIGCALEAARNPLRGAAASGRAWAR